MANKREQAQRMAQRGASASQIERRTGVSNQAAERFVSRAAPASSPGGFTMPTTVSTPATSPGPYSPTYQSTYNAPAAQPSPYQDGVTYRLNDAGTGIAGIVAPGSPGTPEYLATTGMGGVSSTPSTSYRGIQNIRQGLKIGDNSIISKKEAAQIAKNTGKSFDQVLAKGLDLGYQISNNAVRKSNKAYAKSPTAAWTKALGGNPLWLESMGIKPDPLSAMRGVKPGKGRTYSGTYSVNGTLMPLVETKDKGRTNPLGISKPTTPVPDLTTDLNQLNQSADKTDLENLDTDMGDLGTTAAAEGPSPMTPEQMAAESTDGMPNPFSMYGSPTWRRSKKGKGKGVKSTSAASRGQRSMPSSSTLGM